MACKNLPNKFGLYMWRHEGLNKPVYVYLTKQGTPYLNFNGMLAFLDCMGGEILGGPYDDMTQLNAAFPPPKQKKFGDGFFAWLAKRVIKANK